MMVSCESADGGPLPPVQPERPIRVPAGSVIIATSADGRWVAVRPTQSSLVLADLRDRESTVVTERLANVPYFGFPMVAFTASGGLYFSESASDGSVEPVVFQDGARRSFGGADEGRTHVFILKEAYHSLIFVSDDDAAIWSDDSGEVTVFERDASSEDIYVFPTGELRLPGSGVVRAFSTNTALVRAGSPSEEVYSVVSADGRRDLPVVEYETVTRDAWCGFANGAIHRADARTGEVRSERVDEVLEGGQAGGDCVALVRDGAGGVSVRTVASTGIRDEVLPGVAEVDEPFESELFRRFLLHEGLGLVVVEGQMVRVRDFDDPLRLRDVARLRAPQAGILAYHIEDSPDGQGTYRLIRFGTDGVADVIEEHRPTTPSTPGNPCNALLGLSWPYVISGGILAEPVLRCEPAAAEDASRLVVVDPSSDERKILGGRELRLSLPFVSRQGFTVWKEPGRVLVLEVSLEEEGMLELLELEP